MEPDIVAKEMARSIKEVARLIQAKKVDSFNIDFEVNGEAYNLSLTKINRVRPGEIPVIAN